MRLGPARATVLVACAILALPAPSTSAERPPQTGASRSLRDLIERRTGVALRGAPSTSLNPGADTCAAAIDAGTVPPNHVEPAVFLDPGDVEWRSFRVLTPRAVAVSTVGDPLLSDTNLVLFDGCVDGVPALALAGNEDRATDDYTSRVPAEGGRCLAPGTYFVYVGSFFLQGTEAPFEIRIEDVGPCTLPPIDRFEPDDTLEAARRMGAGRPASRPAPNAPGGVPPRTIFPIRDLDFARFELDEPAMVRVRASSPSNGDTLLGVGRGTDGTIIAVTDDESTTSLASRFDSCLPAGSWFAVVLARFTPDTFAYDLSVEKSTRCPFELEPNGSYSRANALPIRGNHGIIWGTQSMEGGVADVDVYRFVVPYLRGVVLETGGYDRFDVDTRIELLDARGRLIASDDDGGEGFLSRIEKVLPSGTYHVAVTASVFEGPAPDSWVYSLSATLGEPPPVEVEPNDLCEQATPLVPGTHVLAALEPAGDRDHYLLTLGPSSMGGFQVEVVIRSTGDPVLDMFEDPGECLSRAACDDDSAEGLDPAIHCCFAGNGAYTLRVRDFRDDDPLPAYSLDVKIAGECLPTIGCPVAPNQLGCDPP